MIDATPSHRIVDQITTATDKKYELVARMADAIVDITLKNDGCLPQDLLARDFAKQDVSILWHFASALASVELKCRANNLESSFVRKVRYA